MADTGRGMAPHVLQRCFEPFFTTKDVGQGPGLGLSVVEGLVTQSGGAVSVDSAPGRGARFQVLLPLAGATGPAAASPPPPAPGHETVLVVEDEPGVRRLVSKTLTARGFVVLSASNPEEADAVERAHGGALDLLVSDVMMPGRSGPELYRSLGLRRPGLKVLFISGYAERTIMQAGGMPAEASLLSKPFTPETLLRRVRDVLKAPVKPN